MSSAQVLNRQLAMVNNFLIDCLLSDSHTFASEVTKFPVESGSTISDNIRNEPLVVVMECLVSNTPIGELATLRQQRSSLDVIRDPLDLRRQIAQPTDDAYDMLLRVRADRRPVSIRTSLRTYDNMALQHLSIPRTSGQGDELKFTVTFQQIEIVSNRRGTRVAIPTAKAKASFSGTTAEKAIEFQALAPGQLSTFGFHPDTIAGQIDLSLTKVQATSLANSAELDRGRAQTQNLAQRVTVSVTDVRQVSDNVTSFVSDVHQVP